MLIGQRLREIREAKNLSQGDIEKRTGLLRCYTSRVENGITIPSIETLEKYARALEVPLYRLFHEADNTEENLKLPAFQRDPCRSIEMKCPARLVNFVGDHDRRLGTVR